MSIKGKIARANITDIRLAIIMRHILNITKKDHNKIDIIFTKHTIKISRESQALYSEGSTCTPK